MDDNIVAQEGKNRATEFVATQLGQQKESSYITNSKKYKEEVKSLQGKTISPKISRSNAGILTTSRCTQNLLY